MPNSNRPARLSPISVKSAASTATTAGDCSWKPQPSSRARRPQGQHRGPQRQEGQHHAARVGHGGHPVAGVVVGTPGEAQHLDRQHREHAGHEVEQQPAEQGAQQRDDEAAGWVAATAGAVLAPSAACSAGETSARGGHGRPAAADRRLGAPGHGLARLPVGLGQRDHHRHRAGAGAALLGQRHAGGPGVAVPGLGPVLAEDGRGVDHLAGFGEELQRLAARGGRQAFEPDLELLALDRRSIRAWPGARAGRPAPRRRRSGAARWSPGPAA